MHGYVPDAFCQSTVIPLVKCKSGDQSDVNNYRAIDLSNSITKILETLLFDFTETSDVADNYQFGFRKKTFYFYMHTFLNRLLIIAVMVVMFLLVLLILTKRSIMTIGCCSVNLLMQMIVFLVLVQHACLHFGIVDRLCVCTGRMYALTILVSTKVCDKEVNCHPICLDFIFVI